MSVDQSAKRTLKELRLELQEAARECEDAERDFVEKGQRFREDKTESKRKLSAAAQKRHASCKTRFEGLQSEVEAATVAVMEKADKRRKRKAANRAAKEAAGGQSGGGSGVESTEKEQDKEKKKQKKGRRVNEVEKEADSASGERDDERMEDEAEHPVTKKKKANKQAQGESALQKRMQSFYEWQTAATLTIQELVAAAESNKVNPYGYHGMSARTRASMSESLGQAAWLNTDGVSVRTTDNRVVAGADSKLSNDHLVAMQKALLVSRLLSEGVWTYVSKNGKGVFYEGQRFEALITRAWASATTISMAPPRTGHVWRVHEIRNVKLLKEVDGRMPFLQMFFAEGLTLDTGDTSKVSVLSVLAVEAWDGAAEGPIEFIKRLLRAWLSVFEILFGESDNCTWEMILAPFNKRLDTDQRLKFADVSYIFDAVANAFCQWTMIIGGDMPMGDTPGKSFACSKDTSRFYLGDLLAAIGARADEIQDYHGRSERHLATAKLPRVQARQTEFRPVSGGAWSAGGGASVGGGGGQSKVPSKGGGAGGGDEVKRLGASPREAMATVGGLEVPKQQCMAFSLAEAECAPQENWFCGGDSCPRQHVGLGALSKEGRARVMRTAQAYYSGDDKEKFISAIGASGE